MAPASDSRAAGFCVTFDNSVNIDRSKGQFIEASNVINSNNDRRNGAQKSCAIAESAGMWKRVIKRLDAKHSYCQGTIAVGTRSSTTITPSDKKGVPGDSFRRSFTKYIVQ